MHFVFCSRLSYVTLCLLAVLSNNVYAADPIPNEDALIAVLQADGDYMTHLAAFRGLRQVGTEKSIPVLATFLHDEKKSHLARYALEDMRYPEAGQALRSALQEATPNIIIGIAATLGARGDAAAVPLLLPLMNHENPAVAQHAKAALGRIGTPEATAALREANAANPSDILLAEALLAAAENRVTAGDKDAAVAIYRALRKPGNPDFVRIGAFNGLVTALPEKTPQRVIKAIQGSDALYRNLAREIVAETRGEDATEAYAAALPILPADVQVEMLAGLARREDKAARNEVVAAIASEEPTVKLGAINALGSLGGAEDVVQLADLMIAPDNAIATAARNSLIRLRGDGVDAAIVAALGEGDAEIRARLLTILDVRISPEAVPQARSYLDDAAPPLRLAALGVFLQQGNVDDFAPVLALLEKAATDEEADLASRTLAAIAKRDSDACMPRVLEALKTGTEPVKLALVDALGDIGGPAALEAATALLEDPSPALQKKALTVLSGWPTQDAAETLLTLAKSDDLAQHDAGIKGYTRLAQNHPEHDPKNAMMATAMELTRSKEDKWMVLSAYGTVHTGPALDALDAQLDDTEVQKEAAMALLKVCEAVIGHGPNAYPRVQHSLELLKSKVQTEYVQKKADELLGRLK